jgi:hypothetical protein
MKPLDKLREIETADKSFRWYLDAIRKVGLASVSAARILKSDIGEFVSSVQPGDMYLFFYDPKLRESLPYYDTVPLVITFRRVPGGFMGLNMHYLPPMLRMRLLNKLMEYTNDSTLSESTKFRLKWSLLDNASRFPGAKVAVKHYLNNYVQSRVLKINPADWKKAIMLPIDNFEKASKNRVFEDSIRNMR